MTWWRSAPAVEFAIHCSGAGHRLRWDRGEVTLLDHDDLDAEIALVAFGGEEPACLSLLRLWEDAISDGGFLAEWVDDSHLTSARLSWLGMALERMASEGFHEFLRDLPFRRAERMGQFLHRYPRPWLDRAASTVSAEVTEGHGVVCANAGGLLAIGIAGRLRRCFVQAVGGTQLTVGNAALVPLTITVEATKTPSIAGCLRGADRGVNIEVGSHWLHEVWGAGLGVVEDHLVLAAEVSSGSDNHLTAQLTVVGLSGLLEPELHVRPAALVNQQWTLDPPSTA